MNSKKRIQVGVLRHNLICKLIDKNGKLVEIFALLNDAVKIELVPLIYEVIHFSHASVSECLKIAKKAKKTFDKYFDNDDLIEVDLVGADELINKLTSYLKDWDDKKLNAPPLQGM